MKIFLLVWLSCFGIFASFAKDKINCAIMDNGKKVNKTIDFSTMKYDDFGYKVTVLTKKDNKEYVLQKEKNKTEIYFALGKREGNSTKAQIIMSGKKFDINDIENSISFICK